MPRSLIVLSDVHLGHRPASAAVARDLARLVVEHPDHEIVLNGDTFDLSWDPPDRDPAGSVASMLAPHRTLRDALRRHLRAGAALTLLSGNHDADVQRPGVREAVLDALACPPQGALHVESWFIRRGDVHIEHGHLYDPDNAPAHPLAPPSRRGEPLGVAITRRFLARHPDLTLLERHEATPIENLRDAVAALGIRAPVLLAEYARHLATINAETAFGRRLVPEVAAGRAALAECCRRTGVAVPVAAALLEARPAPTHTSFGRTFMRLYFDRVAAAIVLAGAVVSGPTFGFAGGALGAVPPLAYLVASSRHGRNRYANRMAEALRRGAAHVREITGARLVLFGHTHIEEVMPGYVNSGRFGDERNAGRPYVEVDSSGRASLRRLSPADVLSGRAP
jgi:predicted phosphodiesterase